MEPESLLPCSQELSTDPYPEPDESSTYLSVSVTEITWPKC
jgi:hypothetical protein